MKPLAILALTLALVTGTANVTLAHVDSLGQPDPSWQQIAAASASGAQVPADGTSPLEDSVSSGGLSLLLLALGAALALDLATAPAGRRGTRDGERAGRTPATAPTGEPAGMMDEEAIRTVERLPPSARGETRHVLRVAAAIVLAALLASLLHAPIRGDGSGRGLAPDDQVAIATRARP